MPHTLRDLCLAWSLTSGPPASLDDDACRRIAGRVPAGQPEGMAGDRWRIWAWRDSGFCVGHARIAGHDGRARADARDGSIALDIDGQPVAWSSVGPGRLAIARTDGPKMRVIQDIGGRHGGKRDILLRQARLVVHDQGFSELRWHVAERWRLAPTEDGYLGEDGSKRALVIKVDPEWTWRTEQTEGSTVLLGRGDAGTVVRVSFELK